MTDPVAIVEALRDGISRDMAHVFHSETRARWQREIDALDALLHDARRYRWLMDRCDGPSAFRGDQPSVCVPHWQRSRDGGRWVGTYVRGKAEADAAIDAAMEAK